MSVADDMGPDLVAALDQFRRSMEDVSGLIRGYHVALVARGFSEDQALVLTCAFQSALMASWQS